MAGEATDRGAAVPTALRKGLRMLEAVAEAEAPVGNAALAAAAGLTRSTLSRLALSLEALGYLERAAVDAGAGGAVGWRLGPAAIRLGLSRLSGLEVRDVAAPLMRALGDELDLPVDLAMPVGEDMLHFELARRAGQLVLATGMGGRLPIVATALGHAALSAMAEPARLELLGRLRAGAGADWPRFEAALSASRQQLQRHGYCVVRGLLRPELSAVAAALRDPRGEVFSFSCTAVGAAGEGERFGHEVGPKLVRMVRAVGDALGLGRRD